MLQSGNKLLIVEDQPVIAEMLEDLAVTLGWDVAAIAYSVEGAMMALEDVRPTLAVLDIDLGDSTSLGIAAICSSRSIPVIFITGFGPSEIPPECANAPVLIKPFSEEAFANAVRDTMVGQLRHA
jgi:DNA-binding response OmpR family regulator